MQPFPKEFYEANSQKTNRSATPLSTSTNYPPPMAFILLIINTLQHTTRKLTLDITEITLLNSDTKKTKFANI